MKVKIITSLNIFMQLITTESTTLNSSSNHGQQYDQALCKIVEEANS